MGDGGGGGGEDTSSRVLIPKDARKMVQDIKEIARKHSDEDVYAMLQECAMDPNEAVQRLLYLDTFHEVKKKRDRKKESSNNRASESDRRRSGIQGRGAWTGRGNYSSHNFSHDAGFGRNAAQKENGVHPRTARGFTHSSLPLSRRAQNNATPPNVPKSSTVSSNGASSVSNGSSNHVLVPGLAAGDVNTIPKDNSVAIINKSGNGPSVLISGVECPPGVYSSASDSVLVPSPSSCLPDTMGTIKHEVSQSAGVETNQLPELSESLSLSTHDDSLIIDSSSTHESQSSLQFTGPSKAPDSETEVATMIAEDNSQLITESNVSVLEEATSNLHISDARHVIFRNHLQIPEALKNGLVFGSFDSSFSLGSKYANGPDVEKSPTPAESSQENIEITKGPSPSNQSVASTAQEEDYPDQPQSPPHAPENLSPPVGSVSSGAVPKHDQSKQEMLLPTGGPHFPVVQPLPNYSFGFMPPMLGSSLVQFEGPDAQAQDNSHSPNIVRGNSLVLSAPSPTPPATQPAGIMQTSIPVSPQSVPVFRPPYPPNYFPYSNYYPPFYVPPAIHQFLSHTGFPQQPPTGNVYVPTAATAAGVKLSHPQYKPGNNTGNSGHIGILPGYGSYSTSQVGYSPSSAVNAGSSTANVDLAASQLKENNIYTNRQQSEGSAVWIPAPGHDISSLQSNSLFNLSTQGQHPTFSPAQAGHGAFTGMYHPTQTMAAPPTVHSLLQQSQSMAGSVDMMGPPGSGYQPPQHAQINWNPNY
ncbi:GBF-interacting protein 1 isoform X3 [Vitis vinifera]|uniref:GBF-interacting protein 1 isoform X3 n=1 Tax=Vitis vinifera TaxID=29760 RepID=UPI00053FEE8F|nr:GBF-interacting protein 1 isoform X3 [Vitis vinifera]|eukprot:XP_010644611.1 PREDICTED: GBF-interacting protein 1 isoform X3 [Vitis vinifera]